MNRIQKKAPEREFAPSWDEDLGEGWIFKQLEDQEGWYVVEACEREQMGEDLCWTGMVP